MLLPLKEYGDDFEDDFEEDDGADDSSSSSSSSSSSLSSSSENSEESEPDPAPASPSCPSADAQVLSPANNPDTHTRRLATAVPRREFRPPADTYARHDWDPGELKKAIDSENRRAETFDP